MILKLPPTITMMTLATTIKSTLVCASLALLIAGCGGGSGTSSGSGTGGNTSFFLTDAPASDYANVWVTIYAVNLVNSSGATVAVFNSSSGLTVDVRHLHDATGQLFEFLDAAGIPAGTYSGAQIYVDNSVSIVPAGSSTATTYQFSTANSGGTGQTLLPVTFNPSYTPNSTNPVVLDFALSNWTINSSNQVVASVDLARAVDVNASGRQAERPINGTIENVTGTSGSQSFNLVHDGNQVLAVQTTPSTTITNASGAANPVLSNAQTVFITGSFTGGAFVADAITIQDTDVPPNTTHFEGTFSTPNATAGTFTLAIQQCDRSVSSTTLTVDTSSTTTFLSDGISETQAAFFAQLALYPNATIKVTGTAASSTVTATTVELDVAQMGSGSHLALAEGLTNASSATAGTLTLTVNGWQGVSLTNGATLSVVTSSTTLYNLNGQMVSQAAWFAAVTPTTEVKVIGSISGTTETAFALVIGSNSDGFGGGGGHH